MGHVDVSGLSFVLPDGRVLLNEVSFRIGDGVKAALVGPNGAGKTTLLRLIGGDIDPADGGVASSGGLGVMRQFVGGIRDTTTVRDLLLSVAPHRVQAAATAVADAEATVERADDERSQIRYAQAITELVDAGGYDLEVTWDACTMAALGIPYDEAQARSVGTLSGGEQKRLVLEALLRGPDQVLLLDEPDNYLDVPGKQWLEERLRTSQKTVLLVSHDRQLIANVADRIVTVESRNVWIHGGGFATYATAREERIARLDELRRRWDEEHKKLKVLVNTLRQKASYNDGMAPAYKAAQTRLKRFEDAGPPETPPREQKVRMRLRGGRTGKRAVICESLELSGLMRSFDTEIWYGERVAVLGSNGSGKTHFLRLLAESYGPDPRPSVAHTGVARLGARVVPGYFVQTHSRPDLHGRTASEIVMAEHALTLNEAMMALARYELAATGRQLFETLSGGQQARLQILLLELSGATLLLLDEPTDNLDLASADALQHGLESFKGTVLAVTHDRWFAADFDRFLIFGSDGQVYEADEPVWDEGRVQRAR
ncbi:ATPase subunit of ABC transporter with duplicated ATPase domains [Herbihabitans rhizosphaerae]|uniref:ATPase subunit of ABC transporter with duplicated ATPase domains n=1 Tax=Herbihabitans rhizosphaerae TaxID=1872711 RepID=A0A4Q7L6J2_9PSEU|nr:ATP-binding cassette domain-containing protein [Herbihabitans rhizosphaerae]RZS44876.1 ATPase subunit of ABC transporter with duplicated ATPase domains [Herbihabitans rhizosphaerae]